MNKVLLVGRLVKEPELRYIGDKKTAVSNFRLAVDRKSKVKDGSCETDFINIEVWFEQAISCKEHLMKGSKVSIEGELRIEHYKDKSGNYKYFTKVKAYKVLPVDLKRRADDTDQNGYHDASKLFEEVGIVEELLDESLPF